MERLPSSDGTSPLNSFPERFSDSRFERLPSSGGTFPLNLFQGRYRLVTRPALSVVTPCHSPIGASLRPVPVVRPILPVRGVVERDQRALSDADVSASVLVGAGMGVSVGVGVLVGIGVGVLVGTGVGVLVGIGAGVLVGVGVSVRVGIGAGVLVGIGVGVLVGVGAGVLVGVKVGAGVGTALGVGAAVGGTVVPTSAARDNAGACVGGGSDVSAG